MYLKKMSRMLTLLLIEHSLAMQLRVSVLDTHAPFILQCWKCILSLSLSGFHITVSYMT